MLQNNAHRRITIGFIIAVLCIGFFVTITYINMRAATQESRNVSASLQRLLQVENFLTNIQVIESSQRGFILTGNPTFLTTHEDAVRQLNRRIIDLDSLSNFPYDNRLKDLVKHLNQKTIFSQTVINAERQVGSDSAIALLKGGDGQVLMDSIIIASREIEAADREILQLANTARQSTATRSAILFFVLAVFVYLILLLNYKVIRRDIKQRNIYEARLRESDMLISSIGDPMVTTDTEYHVTRWNEAMEKLLGWKGEEVTGKFTNDFLLTEFSDSTFEKFQEVFKKDGFWEGEVKLKHKEGHYIYVLSKVSLLRNADGNPMGAASILTDITGRKKLEERLKDLTEKLEEEVKQKVAELQTVYNRITDAVIALDNDWRYTYINPRAEELHFGGAQEFIGKSMLEKFPYLVDSEFYHGIIRARETMEPVRLEVFETTLGKWYESVVYPSKNGVSVYYHDITKRKTAELALEKAYAELDRHVKELHISNERFSLVAKATNDAVWDWDLETNRIMGNEAFNEYFGLSQGGHINYESFITKLHPDDVGDVDRNFAAALKNKEPLLKEEFRFLMPDEKYRVVSDRAYILYDNNGKAFRMLGAMQDITFQKNAEQQLFQEKELSDRIINSLPGIFYHFTDEGKYLRWNRNLELITGYSKSEIGKMNPLDLCYEGHRAAVAEAIRQIFETGLDNNIEADLVLKDGDRIPFYFTGTLAVINGEKTLLGIGLDISEKVKSQQRIAESEEKYRTLIEQASDGIFISNQIGEYIAVNSSAVQISGYSREELLRMKIPDLIYEENQQPSPLSIKQFLKGEIVLQERLLRRKEGDMINVEISSRLLPDGRFQAIVRDITARKRIEEGLKQSEEKRRLIMNASLDAIIFMDVNGLITFWNPMSEKVFGWKAEEVFGKLLSRLILPGRLQPVHDLGVKTYQEHGDGKIFNKLLELRAIRKNMEEFPVELSVMPIRQGEEEFFCVFIRDITERKMAEEELRMSEHKYRLLFNQNPMPMWMMSLPEKNFISVNNAAIEKYGYTLKEFQEMNIRDIRPPEEVEKINNLLTTYQSGINNAGVWKHRTKDGTDILVNIITHDIIYEGRHAKLVLANDITGKVQAEEQLKQSHEQLRELAMHLEGIREKERSHIAREIHDELGQQLTGLKMDMAWISKKITGSPDVIEKIKETSRLIDDTVKTVRRIATQLRPSILDDLGLVAAMEWHSEEFEKRAEIKTVFSSNVAQRDISPEIATAFFRVYQESLTNVMRHSGATKVVSTLSFREGLLSLTIKDNGKGFDERSIKDKKTLGLLGMKERTLLMGGTYKISGKPGKGTTVVIIVPTRN